MVGLRFWQALIILQSIGLMAQILIHSSPVSKHLYFATNLPETTILIADVGLVLILGACCVLARFARLRHSLLLLLAVAWSDTLFRFIRGGSFGSDWVFFSSILRYAWPLALIFLVSKKPSTDGVFLDVYAKRILAALVALTFISHGIKAIALAPNFKDLIFATALYIPQIQVTESMVNLMLILIGTMDLVVGSLILLRPSRGLLAWMGFWGLLTACSRFSMYGFNGIADVLIRSPHWMIPFALLLAKPKPRDATFAFVIGLFRSRKV
ncbi:MAG: hypothetical protein HRU19_24030 [Pseudobacteriovorax sp.]|nr:hypothetical protein [Pseudobacteriovorax sp.]